MDAERQTRANQKMRDLLITGERLVWAGYPDRSVFFVKEDIQNILWSLPFFIIIFKGYFPQAIKEFALGNYAFAVLGLLPFLGFIIVPIYFFFGRYIFGRFVREKTYFGLTNRRILILFPFLRNPIFSIFLGKLKDVEMNARGNDNGTITFGSKDNQELKIADLGEWIFAFLLPPSPRFERVKNVKSVYQLILKTQMTADN